LGEHRVELGEFDFIGVIVREAGRVLELRDEGVQRAVLVVRRAEKAKLDMGLPRNGVLNGAGEL